jgi:hypothetical protein
MPAMNYFDSNRTNTVFFNLSWIVYTRHLVAVPFSVRYYAWQLRSAILLANELRLFFKYFYAGIVQSNLCISSSCDVVYKECWLTQADYWFILRFCEHFTCLSSKIQNAIKLENINNLIPSPSSYQCIRRKLVSISIPCKQRHRMTIYYKSQSR